MTLLSYIGDWVYAVWISFAPAKGSVAPLRPGTVEDVPVDAEADQ